MPIGPEVPYSSEHYDPLWAAAQEMDMPLSLHINSGLGYARKRDRLIRGRCKQSAVFDIARGTRN